MAPLLYFSLRKVLLLYLVFVLFTSVLLLCVSSESQIQSQSGSLGRRRMLEIEIEEKNKSSKSINLSSKNRTKLVKPNLSTKNQTKVLKPHNASAKNQTKLTKSTNSTKTFSSSIDSITKSGIKKLNSTSKLKKLNSTSKASNFTKSSTSLSTKKSSDLTKMNTPITKSTKPTPAKRSQTILNKKLNDPDSQKIIRNQNTDKKPKQQKENQPSWLDQEEDDLISEFRDLPTKFHQTLIPDLERISTTSKAYITKANKEITKNFKPYVGNKYAPTIASFVSFAFIIFPLLLVSLIVNRIKAYFSLQKILIFIQVYLSIYFSILCLSSLVTGLEPLKFLYATARSTYICLQVLQTLAYVLYLLLLLMYMVLVFSTECGLGSRMLGLGQAFVGFAVGLHYYVSVFHRVVLRQPPKTNWKIHGIYATCFLVICLLARVERRKKAYLEDGGGEDKQS